jgi:hypothetical protein
MQNKKNDKPVKHDSAKEPWSKKDVPSFMKDRSQDADRHRKTKHPISDK